eukprot:GHRR01026303.1.p1 GENE.GHRR01026303.1~~GHRR01026303.1.p1  ORF type:complete len:383 (+),score=104.28 GHRR01026303.1:535-1683(+)
MAVHPLCCVVDCIQPSILQRHKARVYFHTATQSTARHVPTQMAITTTAAKVVCNLNHDCCLQGGVCQPAGMAIAAAINARAVPQQPCHQLPALCHHKVMLKHTSAAAHNSRACGAQAWQHLAGQLPSTAAIAWQAPVSASRQMSTAIMCHSTQQPGSPQQISWLSQAHQWPSQMQTSMDHGTPLGENGNGSSRSAFGSGNYNSNSGSSSSSSNGYNRHSSETQPGFAALDATDLHEQHIDAIMVLAGGLTPHGGLPDWVHRRLDVARDLHLLKDRKPPIICLGGGTPHKPVVVGHNGHVIHESTSCAKYLMEAGVQAADILKEVSSYDTVGNAYFSLTIHALPAGWRRIAVVTSHFHMPRSMSLFADLYRMAGSYYFGDPHW